MPRQGEVAVFAASPLIYLGRVGLLREATALFLKCLVPKSVREEVVDMGISVGAQEAPAIRSLFVGGILKSDEVRSAGIARRLSPAGHLSKPDLDCLGLALRSRGRLMADDAALRSAARYLGIPLGGTLYILIALVRRGHLEPPEGVRYLDALVEGGWHCSGALYRRAREALEG